MKKIKERAKESLAKWDDNIYFHYSELTEDSYKDGYIEGATEQKQIDDDYLADIKLMRDEYYCELQKLRQEKVEWLEKACKYLEKYMERLGYIDEWCRSGEDDFCKAMEESPCDSCPTNEDYLNGGECHCSKVEE